MDDMMMMDASSSNHDVNRWGDAPVHSIAVGMFLNKSQVHFFDDIGYRHDPFMHCPTDQNTQKKCHCNADDNFGKVHHHDLSKET